MDASKDCWKICSAFDFDEDTNPFNWGADGTGKAPNLGSFLNDLVNKNQLKQLKGDVGQLTERDKEIFELTLSLAYQIPFAFGYVIGQCFDIPSSEIQKSIESIKTVIRKKALLPYIPREERRIP